MIKSFDHQKHNIKNIANEKRKLVHRLIRTLLTSDIFSKMGIQICIVKILDNI